MRTPAPVQESDVLKMLSIRLFGSPGVTSNGAALAIRRRKSRALLYLLAAESAPMQREHLLGLLWPTLERTAAQQSLRTTLHGLKQALGESLIVDEDQLGLSPAVDVDVRVFEHQLTRPAPDLDALRAALDLYQGEFLEGFSVSGAPEFDDWLMSRSEQYHRLAVRGLTTLAGLYEGRGDYTTALDALDRSLRLDPLQEDVQRSALRLHYLSGDRAGAIRRYDHLRKLLDDEMGVPPMAETRALYDAILNETPSAAALTPVLPPPTPPPAHVAPRTAPALLPFTGRAAELHTLAAWMAQQPHKLVLVEGEPGIGKTRLVEEFIAASERLAVIGSAHELEQGLPYQPIIEGLRGLVNSSDWTLCCDELRARLPDVWRSEMARLLPELMPDQPLSVTVPDEARLWEAMRQFLQVLAQHRPLVVFIDDLQWADSATLALLGYLVRKTASPALVYMATARTASTPAPHTALLQVLIRTDQLVQMSLARLTAEDVAAIAEQLSPDFGHPLAGWLLRASEGNPYVLAEMVRHARHNAILQADGTVNLSQLSTSPVVPHTIYSLIQTRLAQLSDPARRMLDAAVVIGREFAFDVAYRTAGVSEMAALNALDELHLAGIIHPRSDAHYRVDHTLMLEVATREMGEVRHHLLHRRVAEALEILHRRDRDAVAGLIAFHFTEGGAPGQAAPYAFRAGQLAADLAAWTEAIEFFEQALTGDTDDSHRFDGLMALADVHFRAGHTPRASDTYRDALHLAETMNDPLRVCDARLALAQSLFTQGRYSESVMLAERYPPPEDAASTLIAARAELAIGTALSLEGADLAAAAEHLQRGKTFLRDAAERYPDTVIDPLYAAHLDFELGSVAAQQGDLPGAITLYTTALAAAEQSTLPDAAMRRILAHNNLAYHLLLLSDPGALAHAQQGLELAQQTGMLTIQPYLFSTRGEIALAAGELDSAESYFEQGLALAEQIQNLERVAGLTANLGLVARERGELPLAIHRLSKAVAEADAVGTHHLAAQIRIWLAPLLPPREGHALLAEAQAAARSGGRTLLLEQAARLEAQLPPP